MRDIAVGFEILVEVAETEPEAEELAREVLCHAPSFDLPAEVVDELNCRTVEQRDGGSRHLVELSVATDQGQTAALEAGKAHLRDHPDISDDLCRELAVL